MVDTSRTQDTLLTTIFNDSQADSSITAQDMRDLIVSLSPTLGVGQFNTPAVFTVATSGVWVGVDTGTTQLINGTTDIDMPLDGRIRYIGVANRHFALSISISATVAGNNQDCRFRITKNGSPMTETITGRSWGTGTDEGSLSLMTGTTLSTNDYIEIEVVNDSSTGDITIVNGVIILHGFIL